MMSLTAYLLALAAGFAGPDRSTAPVEWQSLFETDGSRWAAAQVGERAYIWTRGHFTRGEAETACSGTHQGKADWRLPSAEELGEVLSRDQTGDRFWLAAPAMQARLEQDSADGGERWIIRSDLTDLRPSSIDLICVRAEFLAAHGT